MMDISKVKLVIWDLDDTFWRGVLSEKTAEIVEENLQLLKNLVDAGVMCSICSKNDARQVEDFLRSYDVWEYFVFTSVNWTPKGARVRQIINEMALRPENVLFIDDNETNLAEVKDACGESIMAEGKDAVQKLTAHFSTAPKTDVNHIRLQQYKVLERKKEFQTVVGSNEDFLIKCNIHVKMNYDCFNHVERIAELVQRSNQLNFTKIRSIEEEIVDLLQDDKVQTGYVEVRDNFGDYGIVGFFAKKEGALLHFVFSCRVLNMGIEQYVFRELGCPDLSIIGEVSSNPAKGDPYWINASAETKGEAKYIVSQNGKMVFKGPCDMMQIFSFIRKSENIITEFTYIGERGVEIFQRNHSIQIVESLTLPEETKERLIEILPFGDKDMFHTAIFDKDTKVVFYSMFVDANLGLYREKQSGAIVAFGRYIHNLTDEAMWEKWIQKEIYTFSCNFTRENLEFIRDNFEYIGRISPDRIVSNLDFIYRHLNSEATLILDLGCETEAMVGSPEEREAYKDRHIFNKNVNRLIRQWATGKERVSLIDVNRYIKGKQSFTDHPNHFTRAIYYQLSNDLIDIIESRHCFEIKQKSWIERNDRNTVVRGIRKALRIARKIVKKIFSRKRI